MSLPVSVERVSLCVHVELFTKASRFNRLRHLSGLCSYTVNSTMCVTDRVRLSTSFLLD